MAGKRGAGEGTYWKREGRWYGKRRIGPRGAVVTINGSGATRAQAVADVCAKVEQRLRGGDAQIDASVSLERYLRWWVDDELADRVADGTIVSTTRQQYATKVALHIVPHLGSIRLRELSVLHLRGWLSELAKQGASTNLRKHCLAVLKTALERAVRYELIPGNPARLIDPPRVRRSKRAEVTAGTARTLLVASATASAATPRGGELEAAYLLALHIPMRVGEVLGAEWDCFDFDRGLFALRQNLVRLEGRWELHDTKKHRVRVVPLPKAVLVALLAQRSRQADQRHAASTAWEPPEVFDVAREAWRRPDFVFTRPTGKPHHHQGFNKRLKALCRAAGLPPLATHDLRRTANTLLRVSGVDPAVIRQLAGHESAEMTELYTTRLDSLMQDAVDRLARQLSSTEG